MGRHYKTLCRNCRTLITQCRCPGPDKEIRWGVCEKCKGKVQDTGRPPGIGAPIVADHPAEQLGFLAASLAGHQAAMKATGYQEVKSGIEVGQLKLSVHYDEKRQKTVILGVAPDGQWMALYPLIVNGQRTESERGGP